MYLRSAMSNKNKKREGIVYSTNPDFEFESAFDFNPSTSANPDKQKLRVIFEKKGRGGKEVTLILGFEGTEIEKATLLKELKSHCGSGGSAKDGEMMIQGDHREKVLKYLIGKGYTSAKRGN